MSFQDRLLGFTDKVKRVVYDEKLKTSGTESRFIRLTTTEDDFGDVEEVVVVNHEEIILEIQNLEEIPLSRMRKDLSTPIGTATSGLYLMDILPITCRARFKDQINKGDILIKKLQDENPNSPPYYLALRVLEPIGTFSPNSITAITYNLAPYTESFSQEVVDIINDY